MVLADASSHLRLYHHEANLDRWRDMTQAVFPVAPTGTVAQRVGFVYHALTAGDGSILHPLKGEFMLPYARPPDTSLRFPLSTAGGFGHFWYGAVTRQDGMDFFADPQFPYAKAALLDAGGEVRFLPHADGIFDLDFRSGSDFQIMERGICLGLHRGDTTRCGPSNAFGY
jgi:hypothetical protein